MYKINQILVGIFKINTNNQYCKLILGHMYVALVNFKGNINEKLSLLNCGVGDLLVQNNNVNSNLDYFCTIDDLVNSNNTTLRESINNQFFNILLKGEFTFSDYVEIKIFEKYFLKYLLIHFSKVINIISNKEELFLNNIKFKNMYYIDLQEEKILYDFKKINNNHCKVSLKFYNNAILWKHLITLLKNLEQDYHKIRNNSEKKKKLEFSRNFDNSSFIKFECTSTFPRYSFFLKYLPVLGGLGIIHVYSQKKLSRQYDIYGQNKNIYMNQTLLSPDVRPKKKYFEFKTIFNFISNSEINITTVSDKNESNNNPSIFHNNQALKYLEPTPLLNIEKFFTEFFIALNPQNDIFYNPKENVTVKYFNMEIVEIINSISNTYIKEQSLDEIFTQINLKLQNIYNQKINGNISLQVVKTPKKDLDYSEILKKFEIGKHYLFIDLFENQQITFNSTNSKIFSNIYPSNGTCNTNIETSNAILSKATFSPLKTHINDHLIKMKGINSCDFEFNSKKKKIHPPHKIKHKVSYKMKKIIQQTPSINELSNTSFSLSKWDDCTSKDDITINLSRKISDINGSGTQNVINHGDKFYNLRKVSFFDDLKGDNTRIDELVGTKESNDNEAKNNFNGNSPFSKNDEYSALSYNVISKNNNNGFGINIVNNNNSEASNVVKFSSLKLGKYYSKEIASKKLIINSDINDSYGKVLTFQKQA